MSVRDTIARLAERIERMDEEALHEFSQETGRRITVGSSYDVALLRLAISQMRAMDLGWEWDERLSVIDSVLGGAQQQLYAKRAREMDGPGF